jgi:YidC/Oxa1 family membrane protein insertase
MDRKSIIILVASLAVVFLLNTTIIPHFFPPIPISNTNTTATAQATNAGATNVSPTAAPTNVAPPAATPTPATTVPASGIRVSTEGPEQTEVLTNATGEAIYTFTSRGGGLKLVQLTRYLEVVGCERPRGANVYASLNEHARVPMLAMQADEAFGDNNFTLRVTSPTSITAEKVLASGLRVAKEFILASNYQVHFSVRIENPTAQTVALPAQSMSAGTSTPMGPRDNGQMMGVFWFNGEKTEHVDHAYFEPRGGCAGIGDRPARLEFTSGPRPIHWAAPHNQFFAIVVAAKTTNAVASQFTGLRVALPRPTVEEMAADPKAIREPHGIEGLLTYPAVAIGANQSIAREYTIYAGPKQEKLLSRVARRTGEIMDFGFWSFLSKLMLRAMNTIHSLIAPIVPKALGDYAMALVIMTIIIKLLFWPLTQKSTQSMKRMQALAPETKKIQEKYKDDPLKAQKKIMELWKEHKVSPMSGCWPMMIQLPIFFALFRMIPNAIELRGAPFLWACDLSKPDTILAIPGLGFPLNPLPILMGITMLIQARMQPPSPGMDPAQQAMLKYMPLIFMVFLYNQPAGLTLYWTVQNLLTIVQTKLTKAKEQPPSTPTAPVTPATPPRKKKK